MLTNPNCLRCKAHFTEELPAWMPTATCDRCASDLLAYVTRGRSVRHTLARIAATRRLYARREDHFVTDGDGNVQHVDDVALPCEVDFTSQAAPVYDSPANDTIWESVERGEREARARALARPGSLGFDG